MTVTEVRLTLRDAARQPDPGVHVRARLDGVGYTADGQIVAPFETLSGADGRATVPLVPSSQITPPAYYFLTYREVTHRIYVPDFGPVGLAEIANPSVSGFGVGPYGSGPYGGT